MGLTSCRECQRPFRMRKFPQGLGLHPGEAQQTCVAFLFACHSAENLILAHQGSSQGGGGGAVPPPCENVLPPTHFPTFVFFQAMQSIVSTKGFMKAHLSGGEVGDCSVRCILHGKTILEHGKMGFELTVFPMPPPPPLLF